MTRSVKKPAERGKPSRSKPLIAVVYASGPSEAERLSRLSRARGDIVQIVRENWGKIRGQIRGIQEPISLGTPDALRAFLDDHGAKMTFDIGGVMTVDCGAPRRSYEGEKFDFPGSLRGEYVYLTWNQEIDVVCQQNFHLVLQVKWLDGSGWWLELSPVTSRFDRGAPRVPYLAPRWVKLACIAGFEVLDREGCSLSKKVQSQLLRKTDSARSSVPSAAAAAQDTSVGASTPPAGTPPPASSLSPAQALAAATSNAPVSPAPAQSGIREFRNACNASGSAGISISRSSQKRAKRRTGAKAKPSARPTGTSGGALCQS